MFNAESSLCITIFVLAYVADQVNHIRRFVFSTVSAFAVFNAETRSCITIFVLAYVAQVNHIRRFVFSTVSGFAVFNAERSYCITIFVLAYVVSSQSYQTFCVFHSECVCRVQCRKKLLYYNFRLGICC